MNVFLGLSLAEGELAPRAKSGGFDFLLEWRLLIEYKVVKSKGLRSIDLQLEAERLVDHESALAILCLSGRLLELTFVGGPSRPSLRRLLLVGLRIVHARLRKQHRVR